MAIVFSRKLQQMLEERNMAKSALRKDSTYDGVINPTALYRLFDKNRAYSVTTETIDRLCEYLNCQPGDIMEYVPNDELTEHGLYYDVAEVQDKKQKQQ